MMKSLSLLPIERRASTIVHAVSIALCVCALAGISSSQEPNALTINALYGRGTPDFVVGTRGDERSDRAVRAQVNLLRGVLFPSAAVLDDSSLVKADAIEWPAHPVLYGGAHVNEVVARIAPHLPFRADQARIEIADQHFEGTEYRLIAAVPARANSYPEFLLYAGAGSPGIAEINGNKHGPEGFLVIDRFGTLLRGEWKRADDGEWNAVAGKRERRIEWRSTKTALALCWRPQQLPVKPSDSDEDAAIARALERARRTLAIDKDPSPIDVYVYPDRGSKRTLTTNAGDGHADMVSRSLHVISFDAQERGPLENLAAHEFTHILAGDAFGSPGSVLAGEGIAVWVSGVYGGKTLDQWSTELASLQPTGQLIAREAAMRGQFFGVPEARSYPLAGMWVRAVVDKVGWRAFADHLYSATADEWEAACKRAGTTAAALESCWPTPDAR